MAIGLQNYPNITAPDSDYPSGRIKDDTGAQDGTPIDLLTNGDLQEFFAKVMRLQSVSPNGLPDNEYSGHQYLEAFWKFINENSGTDIIKGLIGTYTTNDLIVLWGCTVSANIPGTSTITTGAIYYNGITYKVAAASISSPSQTLVFGISGLDIKTINLVNAASGSGIANYNSATVKLLGPLMAPTIGFTAWTSANISAVAGGTLTGGSYKYKVIGKTCTMSFSFELSQVTSAFQVSFAIPSAIRPRNNGFLTTDILGQGMVHFQDNSFRSYLIITDGTANILLNPTINGYGVNFNSSAQFSIWTGAITFEIA